MDAIDFKKSLKPLYTAPIADFTLVDVPPLHYLMLDGSGDPNTSPAYAQALEALYAASYKLKFASKKTLGKNYVVPPLEGLWWADDMESFTLRRDKSAWRWTMMIMVPNWITAEMVAHARDDAARSKDLPALPGLRYELLEEGLCAQILHIGSYDDEAPTIARLHGEWLPQNGYLENGKHHEIYLSDPRRTRPAALKTILRQPIRALAA